MHFPRVNTWWHFSVVSQTRKHFQSFPNDPQTTSNAFEKVKMPQKMVAPMLPHVKGTQIHISKAPNTRKR
jgi:hypothetical protein